MSKRSQKFLDKHRDMWYNIPMKKRVFASMNPLAEFNRSVNKEQSEKTDKHIRVIAEALRRTCEKHFPALRVPVIAGGSVRDVVYGSEPKDYDVFFDLSQVPQDEQDDFVLLFGFYFIQEIGEVEGYKHLKDCTIGALSGPEYFTQTDWKNFFVYENRFAKDFTVARFDADGVMVEERFWIKLQFIGHNDPRLAQVDGPIEFVNDSFDYPLVKALFDPARMEYNLSAEFVATANANKLVVKSPDTYRRVVNWTNRFYPSGCPVKIETDFQKFNAAKYDIKTQAQTYSELLGRGRLPDAAAMLNVGDMIRLGDRPVRIEAVAQAAPADPWAGWERVIPPEPHGQRPEHAWVEEVFPDLAPGEPALPDDWRQDANPGWEGGRDVPVPLPVFRPLEENEEPLEIDDNF